MVVYGYDPGGSCSDSLVGCYFLDVLVVFGLVSWGNVVWSSRLHSGCRGVVRASVTFIVYHHRLYFVSLTLCLRREDIPDDPKKDHYPSSHQGAASHSYTDHPSALAQ